MNIGSPRSHAGLTVVRPVALAWIFAWSVCLLAGCGTRELIRPTVGAAPSGVCVQAWPGTPEMFIQALLLALEGRHIEAEMRPEVEGDDACPVVIKASATVEWDGGYYLATGRITVLRSGRAAGRWELDMRQTAGNPERWINTQRRVQGAVSGLFPGSSTPFVTD